MYRSGDIYYTEEHSISFFHDIEVPDENEEEEEEIDEGDIDDTTASGNTMITNYTLTDEKNTWTDWHLIPSSRPVIANPTVITKTIEKTGKSGIIDLTNYLSGVPNYGMRVGSLSFYLDTDLGSIANVQESMIQALHGKKAKMSLSDDPEYYYEGRFTVGSFAGGAVRPSVTIGYQLKPYKVKMTPLGSEPVIWDTFNFNTDYDYSVIMYEIILLNETKTFNIYGYGFPFTPTINWVSGTVTASFGGVTHEVNSEIESVTLGSASIGDNVLTLTGTGEVKVEWEGGSL